MEPFVVVLVFLASVGLGLGAAYVTLSILLFVMQRAVMRTSQRAVALRRRFGANLDSARIDGHFVGLEVVRGAPRLHHLQ